MTSYLDIEQLDHVYRGEAYAAPAGVFVGLHLATALAAQENAGEGAISVDDDIPSGTRVVVDPGGANEETFKAGAVTGAGPYNVPLLDPTTGAGAVLANTHAAGTAVAFDPDQATLLEPGGDYARQGSSWDLAAEPADDDVTARTQNSAQITFPQETTAPQGKATHFTTHDAAAAGNMLDAGPLAVPIDIGVNVQPQIDVGAAVIERTLVQ